jgi:hypothetical protein
MQCVCAFASAETIEGNSADSLRHRYELLADDLEHNAFQEPLYLDSNESSGKLTGNIYARIPYPFAVVSDALDDPSNWCDVLILHVNTKYCRASSNDAGAVVTLNIGAKHEQRLEDTYLIEFSYRVAASAADYFQVQLDAPTGPLGTRDYVILMEAVSLGSDETFLHLTYSYAYGTAGRFAMNAYLATTGRSKV